MNQSKQRPPYMSVLFLLVLGGAAMALAFWLVDHRQALPNTGLTLAVLIGLFFGSYSWAFLLYLHWRDKSRARISHVPVTADPTWQGTVYGMIPEREYQVMQSFADHYGTLFERGEWLRFKQRHFLPYHGGHTILFDGRALYLQEDQNREILEHFSDYIALLAR